MNHFPTDCFPFFQPSRPVNHVMRQNNFYFTTLVHIRSPPLSWYTCCMNPNTNEQIAFGGMPHQQTISDIELGSVTPPIQIPLTYLPNYNLTIEMQGQQPACGAHAGAYLQDVLFGGRFSPAYLWKKIKQIDGIPAADGTNMISIMKALQKYGVCDFSLLENNVSQTVEQYADASVVTADMNLNASQHKIGGYAFQWSPTGTDICTAIYTHKVVVMLLSVGNEFWTNKEGTSTWAEKDILLLDPNHPISSGHFMIGNGYIYVTSEDFKAYQSKTIMWADIVAKYGNNPDIPNRTEAIIAGPNQWSAAWAREGYYDFGPDYASRVLELGTAVDITSAPLQAILSYGSRGSAVSLLQKKLGLPVDGIFGNQTKAAVEAFQTAHNLTPDGIVGVNTNAVLNSGTLAPMDTTTQSAQISPIVSPITSTVVVTPTVAKAWYTSKTLWFAVLTGISGVIVALHGIYPTAGILITIASLINGILRFSTNTALL